MNLATLVQYRVPYTSNYGTVYGFNYRTIHDKTVMCGAVAVCDPLSPGQKS